MYFYAFSFFSILWSIIIFQSISGDNYSSFDIIPGCLAGYQMIGPLFASFDSLLFNVSRRRSVWSNGKDREVYKRGLKGDWTRTNLQAKQVKFKLWKYIIPWCVSIWHLMNQCLKWFELQSSQLEWNWSLVHQAIKTSRQLVSRPSRHRVIMSSSH